MIIPSPTATHPTRRRRNTGTIERFSDGTFRPRLPGAGKRLEPCSTYDEARRLLDAAINAIAVGDVIDSRACTLRAWGRRWLDEREIAGYRSIGTDRSRWRTWIEEAPFADWPLSAIRARDVRQWVKGLISSEAHPGNGHLEARGKLSRNTAQNILNLLRCALEAPIEAELLTSNPARLVRLPKAAGVTHEPWTYLTPDEQQALLECNTIDIELRCLFAFAIGTGARQGELWNVRFRDVDLQRGFVTFRFGSAGKPRKNGKPLTVPLLPLARWALSKWLPLLARHKNPHGLLWPTIRGERRPRGKAPRGMRDAFETAGLGPDNRHDGRAVRFHDLRHTCASSLVAGWWGEPWTLEQVGAQLGHMSRDATERYAHLSPGALLEPAERLKLKIRG
ncbi:tyrosine-type recombinase/integrase [Polyangium sorediatum]|uniref:Site-specific integrase n=1 Tax=Polyangium sorediatum TaxID=889274 RepID=A0ABT6P2S0_9BACT|nr:site-specific integrase [Polyangium sorediatum]MDI1434909.1 site-specific integrase [Polyangium sorediatum]